MEAPLDVWAVGRGAIDLAAAHLIIRPIEILDGAARRYEFQLGCTSIELYVFDGFVQF